MKSLRERLIAVLANPRPMIRSADHYGPMPCKMATIDSDGDEAVASLFMVN
jgi:hypothetical protein